MNDLCIVGGTDTDQHMKWLREFSERDLLDAIPIMFPSITESQRRYLSPEMAERAFYSGLTGKMAGVYKDLYDILHADPLSDTFVFTDVDLENSVSVLTLDKTGVLDDPHTQPDGSRVIVNGDTWFITDVYKNSDDTKYPVHVKSESDFMNVVRKCKTHERTYRASNGTVFTIYG